jgi:hypothetical protein
MTSTEAHPDPENGRSKARGSAIRLFEKLANSWQIRF